MKKFCMYFLILALQVITTLACIEAQVSMVKDIYPGGESAFTPTSKIGIGLNGSLLFPAYTPENGIELWISDGSEDGTFLLSDINPGNGGSEPHSFFSAFQRVFFSAFTPEHGRELWVTDGTTAGTHLVMDIESGSSSSDPSPGDLYEGYLYFAATSSNDREIWRVDSLGQVELFINLNPTAQSRPREFKTVNGKLYFSANINPLESPDIDEDEPFVTNGTVEGTVHLEIYVDNNDGADVSDFTGLENDVFFLASPTGGINPTDVLIFKTQGTPLTTGQFFFDLYTPVYWLMPVNGKINFMAQEYLFSLEGNSVDAVDQLSCPSRREEQKPNAYVNGNLCFPAQSSTGDYGIELYFSDGDNTWLSMDIYEGIGSSDPWHIVSNGSKAVFAASSSETNRELYESDGTTEGTRLVADLNPGDDGSNPFNLVLVGNRVFFYAYTPETGFELFKYDLEPTSVRNTHHVQFKGKVYPQPAIAGHAVTVELAESQGWISAELLDPKGTVVSTYEIENMHQISIETKNLHSGIYFLNFYGQKMQSVYKIVIP